MTFTRSGVARPEDKPGKARIKETSGAFPAFVDGPETPSKDNDRSQDASVVRLRDNSASLRRKGPFPPRGLKRKSQSLG